MTEEEAKTKWCPFVRTMPQPYGTVIDNRLRLPRGEIDCNCIASACMAWRSSRSGLARLELEARVHRPEVVYMVQQAMTRGEDGNGFCGLAGGPQ